MKSSHRTAMILYWAGIGSHRVSRPSFFLFLRRRRGSEDAQVLYSILLQLKQFDRREGWRLRVFNRFANLWTKHLTSYPSNCASSKFTNEILFRVQQLVFVCRHGATLPENLPIRKNDVRVASDKFSRFPSESFYARINLFSYNKSYLLYDQAI